MTGILTRAALKTLTDTNLPGGLGSISSANHRAVHKSIADSALMFGEAEVVVISMALTAPPGSPADRDAYVVAATAAGAWAGQENKVAIWDASISPAAWVFDPVYDGKAVWNLADDMQYRWDAGASPAAWSVVTAGGTSSYDVPVVFGGTPTGGQIIGRYTMVRTVDFPANFAGSVGTVEVAPSATFNIDVLVGDDTVSPPTSTSIGTVSISTAGAYTFTTVSGTAKQITPGQKLEFVSPSPSPAEASIDGISFMLLGAEG